MALSKEEILEAIAEMSVIDVVELIEAMEEKFGVTAAAPVLQLLHLLLMAVAMRAQKKMMHQLTFI